MDLSHPFSVVSPTVDGDVLCVLAGADAWFTSGQIQRIASQRSPAGVRRTLDRLTEQGLVSRQAAGRAYLYRLNREHLAAPAVAILAGQRSELLRRLGAEVTVWSTPPVYGALFGSGARDDHSPNSDLDIFLVQPDGIGALAGADDAWAADCERLGSLSARWTGNDARILALPEAAVRAPGANADLLASISQDAMTFIGAPGWLRRALRREARP